MYIYIYIYIFIYTKYTNIQIYKLYKITKSINIQNKYNIYLFVSARSFQWVGGFALVNIHDSKHNLLDAQLELLDFSHNINVEGLLCRP